MISNICFFHFFYRGSELSDVSIIKRMRDVEVLALRWVLFFYQHFGRYVWKSEVMQSWYFPSNSIISLLIHMNEIEKKNIKQKPNVTVSRAWSWTAPMQNVWDMKWKKSENAFHLICCAPLRMRLQLETGVRSIASAENWSKSQISSGNITRIYLPWNKNKTITIIT